MLCPVIAIDTVNTVQNPIFAVVSYILYQLNRFHQFTNQYLTINRFNTTLFY